MNRLQRLVLSPIVLAVELVIAAAFVGAVVATIYQWVRK